LPRYVLPQSDVDLLGARLTVNEDSRVRVVALRGLPGSGKSTLAGLAVNVARVPGSVVRMNNDDLAAMLFGSATAPHSRLSASILAATREAVLSALLNDPRVRLVIVDNTNINTSSLRALESVTLRAGARFEVDDTLLQIPADECIRRDSARPFPVGPEVIRKMAAQAAKLQPWSAHQDLITEIAPYPDNVDLPSVVLVDIDGTLALRTDRGPYDWGRVGEDLPNQAVVGLVQDLIAAGQHIIVMSGRDGSCLEQTRSWLDVHVHPGLELHLRETGDTRQDTVVKHDMFREHIAGRYRVRFVLDDRDQVVSLWRTRLQLPTFQVADGAF
jgi:predicted kinase